jgi:excisionase family DNA binding protein
MNERPFMSIQEVAKILGRTTSRCYQMINAGQLPAVRIGGAWRVPRLAWQAWIQERSEAALAVMKIRKDKVR